MANPDPEGRSGRRVLHTRHICYTMCLSDGDSQKYQTVVGQKLCAPNISGKNYNAEITYKKGCAPN
jgi:hypothetical protein